MEANVDLIQSKAASLHQGALSTPSSNVVIKIDPGPSSISINEGANRPAQDDPALLAEVKAFVSQLRGGESLKPESLDKGKEFSRQIEQRSIDFEAGLERNLAPLMVEHGKIILSFKRYAEDHNLRWNGFAQQSFPHMKLRKRQNLMFLAQNPEVADHLGTMGLDRSLRFYRAGKRFDRKHGMDKLAKKFNLNWDPKSDESLMDFRVRVDQAIASVYPKSAKKSLNQLLAGLDKWITSGVNRIGEIISDDRAPGYLEPSDLKRIETAIGQLRDAIEKAH
jgi:hypothetical protein